MATVKSLEERIDQIGEDVSSLRTTVAVLVSKMDGMQVQIATTLSAIQAVQSQLAGVAQKTDATATRLDQVEKKVETLALSYTAFEAKGEVTNKLLRWVGGLAALAIVSFIGFGYSLARHAGSLDEKVQHHQDTLNDIKAKLK